jgi:hypothetical protein
MANIFEIDMTLKDIDANPRQHNQRDWARRLTDDAGEVCGTAMCAAGFTVVRHGYKFMFYDQGSATHCRAADGTVERISVVAGRILDLSADQAAKFFAQRNSRLGLKRLRDQFAQEELREHVKDERN